MAVAAAASQHHALSSVLRISPPPFHSRLTYVRASLYLLPSPPSLSLSHSTPRSHVFPSTASQPPSLQSLVLLSSLSLFRLPARLPFKTISLRRLRFFISLSLSSVHRFFALPLLMEKEREMKRMVEDPQAPLSHRSSLLRSKCSPERDGESGSVRRSQSTSG